MLVWNPDCFKELEMPEGSGDKRFTIFVGGYVVLDAKDDSLFFASSPCTYFDAPLDVLQFVHDIMQKHGSKALQAMEEAYDDLIDVGTNMLPDEGRGKVTKEARKRNKENRSRRNRED